MEDSVGSFVKGVMLMIFAALCFTVMNMVVRYIDHLPTMEIVFFRAVGSLLCCWWWMWRYRISPVGNKPRWLVARAVVGLISMSLYYKAIQVLPLGSAVSLRYLSPFFAAVLAVTFLGERMRAIQWIFIATAFAGVLLLKGVDVRVTGLGLVLTLSSAFFSGLVYFIIRKIGTSEASIVIVHYFIALSTLVGGTSCLFDWVAPQGWEWGAIGIFGLLGFAAQWSMTFALQTVASTIITPFKYLEVVFTLVAGWLIFGEYQTLWSVVGIVVIIASLLAHVYTKSRDA